jgi:hypothetical protein
VRMSHKRVALEAGQLISTRGRLLRWDELALVVLGAAAGLLWGLLSLILGMPLHLAQISGPLRVAATLLNLPLSLAWWLGSTLQLPLVDPIGLVMATGAILGLLPSGAWLGFERWRDR